MPTFKKLSPRPPPPPIAWDSDPSRSHPGRSQLSPGPQSAEEAAEDAAALDAFAAGAPNVTLVTVQRPELAPLSAPQSAVAAAPSAPPRRPLTIRLGPAAHAALLQLATLERRSQQQIVIALLEPLLLTEAARKS